MGLHLPLRRRAFRLLLCCAVAIAAATAVLALRRGYHTHQSLTAVTRLGGDTTSVYRADGTLADAAGKVLGRHPSDTPFGVESHYVNLSGRHVTPADLGTIAHLPGLKGLTLEG